MPMSTPRDPLVATEAFEISPTALTAARAVVAEGPDAVYRRLARDQESECVFALARHVLHGFLGDADAGASHDGERDADDDDVAGLVARTERGRGEIAGTLGPLSGADRPWRAVLAQRAPLALLDSCWLDTVSQPASQPATVVNHLVRHQFALRGQGIPQQGRRRARARALDAQGVWLPDITAEEFLGRAESRPLTCWHGAYRLSLAKVPATFLPEVVGTHCVLNVLGLDDLLFGTRCPIPAGDLWAVFAEYHAAAPPPVRRRLRAAADLALAMEREHARLLADLAQWHAGLSLDAQVARIVVRHAPFAGKQHRLVRVGGRPLTEWFADVDASGPEFVRRLRESPQLKPRDGGCRFLRAIRFGGPMFGIFGDEEAATFERWANAIAAGEPPGDGLGPNTVGDDRARALADAVAAPVPDAVPHAAEQGDDREFFHHLVNIENFPGTLDIAWAYAEEGLRRAEVLFEHGADGALTDASWFDYSREALEERVDRVYWDKLVNPYAPLTEIPSRDEVIFGQKTFALGSMIDGSWAHRIGATGHDTRRSDDMLYAIYADEMGRGDPVKNHITLIYQVLDSMGINVPHIRDTAFLDQDELPDHLYGFSLFQLSLALFPDSCYDEILGYNLGIEMFGLGAQRMHEMQKLRRYGFDVAYEEAHLSIDNLSAGHARQSVDIIVAYLHDVATCAGADAVAPHWRRIWRGYASFAYFIEHRLVESLRDTGPTELLI
jgi:heme oxygenase-like protein